jgi:hypothetical protein
MPLQAGLCIECQLFSSRANRRGSTLKIMRHRKKKRGLRYFVIFVGG